MLFDICTDVRTHGGRILVVIVAIIATIGGNTLVGTSSAHAAPPPCGSPQVSGAAWLDGHGVDVNSNGTDQGTGNSCAGWSTSNAAAQDGYGWQCVELASRLYAVKGWGTVRADGGSGAGTYRNGAKYIPEGSPSLTFHANGSGYVPVPGDLIIEWSSTWGHVAVVDHVSGGSVYAVEQNASPSGWHVYALSSSTLTGSYSGYVRGLIHAPANTSTNNVPPAPAPVPPLPGPGTFGEWGRYYDGASHDHWTTTGAVPASYGFEGSLGGLLMTSEPGTRPLYACRIGGDEFTSSDASCEGQHVVGWIGNIYTSQPNGIPTVAVYRCTVLVNAEHFDSHDPNCEGQHTEELLGYAQSAAVWSRYYNASSAEHWTTTGGVLSGYAFEGSLGILLLSPDSNTRPLYACQIGSDEFTSADSSCESQHVLGWLGYVYLKQPTYVPTVAVYRCVISSNGEHFDSHDPNCEGQHQEGLLGYAIAELTWTRYYNGSSRDHWTTTGGVPTSYGFEGSLGGLIMTSEPGTRPLYACQISGDEFTSPDTRCEGQHVVGWIGNIYTSQPNGIPTVAVYRCTVSANAEHFDSHDPNCEGQHTEDLLGYAVSGLDPTSPTSGAGAGHEGDGPAAPPADTVPPTARLSLPGGNFTTKSTLSVAWSGNDTGSGVINYDVRFRSASSTSGFGPWHYPTTWKATTAEHATSPKLSPGATYCFEVRARDDAGNLSNWSSARCTSRLLDDRAFAAHGAWSRERKLSYYLNTYSATSVKNAYLSRSSVQADRVALLVRKCPACGEVGVYTGKTLVARINLRSGKSAAQLVVLKPFTYRRATIAIKSLGNGEVRIDGVGLTRA